MIDHSPKQEEVRRWLAQARELLSGDNPKLVAFALEFARKALALDPENLQAHRIMARTHRRLGTQAEAEEWLERTLALAPDSVAVRLERATLQLPPMSRNLAEIERGIERYTQFLTELIDTIDLDDPQVVSAAVTALGQFYPFQLSYLKVDIRALQALYGRFVSRVMAAHWPQWSYAPHVPPPSPNQPIRIGIPYAHFCEQSQWFLILKGWLAALDKTRFEITGYHLGKRDDEETEFARQHCHHFVEGSYDLAEWAARIRADSQHMLLYPDTKMNLNSLRLAALRLAPVQMTTWGQVYTTGLPTIDYFLSSELMEPAAGDDHYTEQLVRLPNLSLYYLPKEVISKEPLPRSHFKLRDSAVVYACTQSLWKYQPQHDHLFARIAAQVRDSQFVFIKHFRSEMLSKLFYDRLKRVFARHNCNVDDHVVLLPFQTPQDFQSLSQLVDVYLDTPEWCGMATTMEVLRYGVPIVTLAGAQFRGRTGLAILRQLGVTETISADLESYIAIAARLGTDVKWRHQIRAKMRRHEQRAYRDAAAIDGLETFLTALVHASGPPFRG